MACVFNYLEVKSLRELNEEFIRGFFDEERATEGGGGGKPRVWIEGKKVSLMVRRRCSDTRASFQLETGYLKHVIETFEKLGYTRVNGSEEDWDVLWSHEYPFGSVLLHELEPHQKVSQHLPHRRPPARVPVLSLALQSLAPAILPVPSCSSLAKCGSR